MTQSFSTKLHHCIPCDLTTTTFGITEALDASIKSIFQATGCSMIVTRPTENSAQIALLISGSKSSQSHAIEKVENILVKVLGAEESKGRLLYDIARSFQNNKKDEAVLETRNPLNSSNRVWMALVELPEKMILNSSFNDSSFQGLIHDTRCTVLLGKHNFGTKLVRCQPYVLILGKQSNHVNNAVNLTKKAIRLRQSSQEPHTLGLHETRYLANKSNANTKKMMLPVWLLADASYQKEIEGVLFIISC